MTAVIILNDPDHFSIFQFYMRTTQVPILYQLTESSAFFKIS
jgi:hypothetical protein